MELTPYDILLLRKMHIVEKINPADRERAASDPVLVKRMVGALHENSLLLNCAMQDFKAAQRSARSWRAAFSILLGIVLAVLFIAGWVFVHA